MMMKIHMLFHQVLLVANHQVAHLADLQAHQSQVLAALDLLRQVVHLAVKQSHIMLEMS